MTTAADASAGGGTAIADAADTETVEKLKPQPKVKTMADEATRTTVVQDRQGAPSWGGAPVIINNMPPYPAPPPAQQPVARGTNWVGIIFGVAGLAALIVGLALLAPAIIKSINTTSTTPATNTQPAPAPAAGPMTLADLCATFGESPNSSTGKCDPPVVASTTPAPVPEAAPVVPPAPDVREVRLGKNCWAKGMSPEDISKLPQCQTPCDCVAPTPPPAPEPVMDVAPAPAAPVTPPARSRECSIEVHLDSGGGPFPGDLTAWASGGSLRGRITADMAPRNGVVYLPVDCSFAYGRTGQICLGHAPNFAWNLHPIWFLHVRRNLVSPTRYDPDGRIVLNTEPAELVGFR